MNSCNHQGWEAQHDRNANVSFFCFTGSRRGKSAHKEADGTAGEVTARDNAGSTEFGQVWRIAHA